MTNVTTIKRRSMIASASFCALYWVIVALLLMADDIDAWQLAIMQLCGFASLCSFLVACACEMAEEV